MKSGNNISAVRTTILSGLLIALFFVAVPKVSAQSSEIGNDINKIQTSLKLKTNNSEFTILIPKLKIKELGQIKTAQENQLVFITDINPGIYIYSEKEWNKTSFKAAIDNINNSLQILTPKTDSIILSASLSNSNTEQMLDYNNHIVQLVKSFDLNSEQNNFAVESGR